MQTEWSQMPFGFWVLGNLEALQILFSAIVSQMPFGFWVLGNGMRLRNVLSLSAVSNAFRLLGSGEPSSRRATPAPSLGSQMPFGFWVLGNHGKSKKSARQRAQVSNAFRLLGSGEPMMFVCRTRNPPTLSQMPFGFWVLGNCSKKIG